MNASAYGSSNRRVAGGRCDSKARCRAMVAAVKLDLSLILRYVVRTTAIYAKVDRKPYASGRDPQLTTPFRRASQASSRWRPTMQARVSSDLAVPRPSFASS